MIETGLRTLLLKQPGITGIAKPQVVDGITYAGVFNESVPQAIVPTCVVIRKVGFNPLETLDGTGSLRFTDFELDACSRDYPTALQLEKALQDFLFPDSGADYTGPAGPDDLIQAVIFDGRESDWIAETPAGDMRIYRETLKVQVQHQPR